MSRKLAAPLCDLLRASLGGALLALITACSGDMDAGSDGFDGELEDQDSELVDVFDSADAPEATGAIEKATFNDNATYNGFNVSCTTAQKALINAAQTRAVRDPRNRWAGERVRKGQPHYCESRGLPERFRPQRQHRP